MKIVTSAATLFLLIAFSLMTAAGLSGPGAKAWAAEADRAELVRAVADLSELRDRIADRWALLMKSGWNVYADDQLVFAELDQTPAKFKTWLETTPPDDRLKVEKLMAAVAQVPTTEIAYVDSVRNMRHRASLCLLNVTSMLQIHRMVTGEADALVLGHRPQATSVFPLLGSPPSALLSGSSFDPQALPEVEPSSDPASLRAGYEAVRASQDIYSLLLSISYEVPLAMLEYIPPPTSSIYAPQHLERLMEPLRRLPGLTGRKFNPAENIPKSWAGMAGDVKAVEEALTRKQAAQADLEQRVQAALAAIDELRASCLNRLAE